MMARGKPVTEAERMKIRVLHGQGWTATRIAKELSRPVSTISKCAAQMHLHFDHAQTAAATKAAAIDMKARRARIAARLLDESEELLDDIKRPYMDHTFTQAGEYVQHAVMPVPQDKAHLTRGAANLLAEHRRMAEFDAGDDGATAGRSMIGKLFAGLAEAAGSEEAETPPEG
jgi:capsule polysaccharide export protein KpsE/RkpR